MVEETPKETIIEVHVTPSSRRDSILWDGKILKIHTRASPEKNKANKAVIALMKPYFKDSRLISGLRSRKKSLQICGIAPDKANKILSGLNVHK